MIHCYLQTRFDLFVSESWPGTGNSLILSLALPSHLNFIEKKKTENISTNAKNTQFITKF